MEKGVSVRVVSMPSWQLFEEQPEAVEAAIKLGKDIADKLKSK